MKAVSEEHNFRYGFRFFTYFRNMSKKPKLVVLTGAGISAESGLATFRAADGLWEGHKVEEVATPEAWRRNPDLVLEFYNQRRKSALAAQPNAGHLGLVVLETDFEVQIITQNVDDLHERAGSKNVLHLHGKLFEARSTLDPALIYPVTGWELNRGDKCARGSQLRPNIVWFGEAVPMMEKAIAEVLQADAFAVVGTSLVVYPAAGLVDFVPAQAPVFVIDPALPTVYGPKNLINIPEKATTGVPRLAAELRKLFSKEAS